MAQSKQVIDTKVSEFSFDLYKKIASQSNGNNAFISSSSVFIVMAMLHAGAKNKTQEQLTSGLKLNQFSSEEMLKSMNKFVTILASGSESVALSSANRLYPNKQGDILQSYIDLMKKHFLTEVKPTDFAANPDGSRQEINTWVESQTKSKIKDLLPSGSITGDTSMVLVNAVYFKGDWETPFEGSDTRPRDFHVSKDSKVKVDMMSKKFSFGRFGENKDLDCKVLEMRYKGNEVGMVVLLPNAIDGLKNLEAKLHSMNFKNALDALVRDEVVVSLPKFKMECSVQMKPILMALGIVDAFDIAKADFTGMGNQLYVSEVFHKAYVDVNEKGTEAAAATAAVMLRGCMLSRNEPFEFIADHPFLFAIWDHRLNVPLFMGRYTGPK